MNLLKKVITSAFAVLAVCGISYSTKAMERTAEFQSTNVVMLGNVEAKKYEIIKRIKSDLNYDTTFDLGSNVHIVNINGIDLQIFDTAGQERYRSLIPSYVRGAKIAVIVGSLKCGMDELINSMNVWSEFVDENAREDVIKIFVLNERKSDSPEIEEAMGMLRDRYKGFFVMNVNVKNGNNIGALSNKLAEIAKSQQEQGSEYVNLVSLVENRRASKPKCC